MYGLLMARAGYALLVFDHDFGVGRGVVWVRNLLPFGVDDNTFAAFACWDTIARGAKV